MNFKVSDFKTFADASAAAVSRLISLLDSEGRQRLDDALGRGCRVQIGFTVDSFGNSEISLELISGDDRSKVLSLPSRAPNIQ